MTNSDLPTPTELAISVIVITSQPNVEFVARIPTYPNVSGLISCPHLLRPP